MAVLKIVNNHSKSKAALRKILNYVLKEEKTSESISYVHGDFIGETISPQTVFDQFMRIKTLFGKQNGRMYQHGIISFHKDEAITPEMALSFGKAFVSKQYPDNQALVCVHIDRDHTHIHFVVNTVSFMDAKMLHWHKSDLKKAKELSDRLCDKYGLSITQKGKHYDDTPIMEGDITAWNKNTYAMIAKKPKEAFLADCMSSLQESLKAARTQQALCDEMKKRGWNVIWEPNRKHITFVNSDGKKVRDAKLSKLFNTDISKESLTRHFTSAAERQHKRHKRRR